MKDASSRVSTFLIGDIEEAQATALATPPSLKRRLIEELLHVVLTSEFTGDDAIRLLEVAQYLLAGIYPYYFESELSERLGDVVRFAHSAEPVELQDRAIAVAALLINRMRAVRSSLSPETRNLLFAPVPGISLAAESTLTAMRRRVEVAENRVALQRRGSRSFELPEMDVGLAATTVREDIEGDWYRDPWGWPEVAWLASSPNRVMDRLKHNVHDWTVDIDVPKGKGAVRPGIVINPLDRLAYQCLVDAVSVEAASHLPKWVYGWRLGRASRTRGVYESNHNEWRTLKAGVVEGSRSFEYTAHLDIQSFFRDVDTSILISQLSRRYRNAGVLDRLESYFENWHQHPNGVGLPQRSFGSAVLIHVLLRPVDTYLDTLCRGGASQTFRVSRWMDDIWLHSDNEDTLEECIVEVGHILRGLRMSLNAEKTEIVSGTDKESIISTDDDYSSEPDETLSIDGLLEGTEGAPQPRWVVSQAISKLIRFRKFGLMDSIESKDFWKVAHLGHNIAWALRVAGRWRDFTDSYLKFAHRHVSEENLSVASWAEMFPNAPEHGTERVGEYFLQQVARASQRMLTPLAGQRLAAWRGPYIEQLITGLIPNVLEKYPDKFRLRGLSLAGLSAGLSKNSIRTFLRDSGDETTAAFLEETSFVPPPLAGKFHQE